MCFECAGKHNLSVYWTRAFKDGKECDICSIKRYETNTYGQGFKSHNVIGQCYVPQNHPLRYRNKVSNDELLAATSI